MIAASQRIRFVRWVVGVASLLASSATIGWAQNGAIPPDEFHIGDRIALTIEAKGISPVADTVTVRDGQIIRLPAYTAEDISLKGVRRSDVKAYLTKQVSKYLQEPILQATPLIRVAILGAVNRPGYYSVPSDMILTDVVMRADGPSGNADPSKTVIRRAGKEVVGHDSTAHALTSGKTLDDLRIAPGDEIVIGEQDHRSVESYIRFGTVILSATVLILALIRR